jgi:hypothetical protein
MNQLKQVTFFDLETIYFASLSNTPLVINTKPQELFLAALHLQLKDTMHSPSGTNSTMPFQVGCQSGISYVVSGSRSPASIVIF